MEDMRFYGILETTVVIEMAACAGLPLVEDNKTLKNEYIRVG